MYALFDTSKGKIKVKLFKELVPEIVDNFSMLAQGTHPAVGEEFKNKKFYDGLIFHRVISNFMIQGGCPLGTGTGSPNFSDPKYQKDQFHPELRHDRPGLLSMANAGPNTNGSQFFITTVPTPWLDDKHSIFGEVVEGLEVVKAIEEVPKGFQDRPEEDVTIHSVAILDD